MELYTAAKVVSYISEIEQESLRFYETWAEANEALRATFLSFIKENLKYEKRVKRAYYGAVTDALETGFSFKGLRGDLVIPSLGKESSPVEVLEAGLDMEEAIQEFYRKASGLSKSLLADVSRAMAWVAKTRNARIKKLHSMSEEIR